MKPHSRLARFSSRAVFKAAKLPLALMSLVHHRPYMALYGPLLRRFGMTLKGQPRYISRTCYFDNIRNITLGDRVVISTNVRFLTHDYSVTTALRAIGDDPPRDIASERSITLGSNVFVGLGSIIMPNTHIGDHVIVGAGSVVRGEIPAFSIVAGNPATVIGDVREYGRRWKQKLNSSLVRVD
jgi:acetyltransferase-like isoleucine patch superfamily enzyme